jgi:DNA-binding transcriptional MerR regulator
MADEFTIGALARSTRTNAETIRYYERIGLLPRPARSAGNYRKYAPADARRLAFIRRGRDLGFSIEEVRALLELSAGRDQDCATVDRIARDHLAEVERRVVALERLADELRRIISCCAAGVVSDCRVIESLAADCTSAATEIEGGVADRRSLVSKRAQAARAERAVRPAAPPGGRGQVRGCGTIRR